MKVEWRTIVGAAVFLAVIFVIYFLWAPNLERWSGSTMLFFSFAAYTLLGSYLILQYRRRKKIHGPEDRFDAEQADGAGAVAFFPSASIWPGGIGLGMCITSMAFIYGNWYWLIGLPLVFGGVIGFVVESEHTLDLIEDVPEEMKQHSTLTEPE